MTAMLGCFLPVTGSYNASTAPIGPYHFMTSRVQDDLRMEGHWRVNGTHYSRTSEAWLNRMDTNKNEIMPVLAEIYGEVRCNACWPIGTSISCFLTGCLMVPFGQVFVEQ